MEHKFHIRQVQLTHGIFIASVSLTELNPPLKCFPQLLLTTTIISYHTSSNTFSISYSSACIRQEWNRRASALLFLPSLFPHFPLLFLQVIIFSFHVAFFATNIFQNILCKCMVSSSLPHSPTTLSHMWHQHYLKCQRTQSLQTITLQPHAKPTPAFPPYSFTLPSQSGCWGWPSDCDCCLSSSKS